MKNLTFFKDGSEVKLNDFEFILKDRDFFIIKIKAFYAKEKKLNKSYLDLVSIFENEEGLCFKDENSELRPVKDLKIKPLNSSIEIDHLVFYY